jgi:hypothetical protein
MAPMANAIYVFHEPWVSLPWSVYPWTFASVVYMLVREAIRGRGRRTDPPSIHSGPRHSLAFFHPVFLWGIEAVVGFRRSLAHCISGNVSPQGIANVNLESWGVFVQSLAVFCVVAAAGVAVQAKVCRLAGGQHPVGLPLFVVGAFASVGVATVGTLFIIWTIMATP